MVDGVLHIPKKVVDIGVQKLKSALVIQFLDDVPLLKVIRSVLNRLWGFEGEVIISLLPNDLFLVELPSVKLCELILARSWHIHYSSMILRRWESGIKPIDTSPKELPIWLIFKGVPPALVTHEGVSWLASQVGTPFNKFIRDGLDVKVCGVKDVSVEVPASLMVVLEGGEQSSISVECREPRTYKGKEKVIYVPKVKDPQPKVSIHVGSSSGNGSKPSLDGEEAPESSLCGMAVGGMGNGSEVQAKEPPIQQPVVGLSLKSVSTDNVGVLVSDDEEVVYDETRPNPDVVVQVQSSPPTDSRRVVGADGACQLGKSTFSEFISNNKVLTPKGIIHRPKTRRR
ncbi:hypothetical protein LINPERHAP1_LOCUS19411 [Linum perenne]